MVIKFSCKICNKAVASNHHVVQCDKCHSWVHIKCNKINIQAYKFLQKSPSVWYCIKCFEDIVPFETIANEELFKTNQGSKIKLTVLTKYHTPPSQDLIDQLNEAMDDPSSETVSSNNLKQFSLRLWNTGLVSSGASLTSWGEDASLALVGNPSSDGITIKIPYGVDVWHQPALHPIFSYWVG